MPIFHSIADIVKSLKISRSSVYAQIVKGTFPAGVKLGLRSVRWPSGEIDQVVAAHTRGATEDELRAVVSSIVAARNGGAQ